MTIIIIEKNWFYTLDLKKSSHDSENKIFEKISICIVHIWVCGLYEDIQEGVIMSSNRVDVQTIENYAAPLQHDTCHSRQGIQNKHLSHGVWFPFVVILWEFVY